MINQVRLFGAQVSYAFSFCRTSTATAHARPRPTRTWHFLGQQSAGQDQGLDNTPSLSLQLAYLLLSFVAASCVDYVGKQLEERMRFSYQKPGNARKFEYSNRIDQKIVRCSQQNHDVLIPISKEVNEKIKVLISPDHTTAV